MPTNCTFDPHSLWAASSNGISSLHGTHQVAQKFTSTGVPLYFERLTSPLPSWRLGRVKLGASSPAPAVLPAFFPPLVSSTAATTAPTRTTTTTATIVRLDTRASLDVDRSLHVRVHVAVEVELPGCGRRELVVLLRGSTDRVLLVERVAAAFVGRDVDVVRDRVLVVEVDDDRAVGLEVQGLLLEVDVLRREAGGEASGASTGLGRRRRLLRLGLGLAGLPSGRRRRRRLTRLTAAGARHAQGAGHVRVHVAVVVVRAGLGRRELVTRGDRTGQ